MPMDPKQVESIIQKALPGARVKVEDTVGDGDHLQATVISDLFEGKRLLAQHQMVYAALKEELKENIHALGLKTFTLKQWNETESS